MVRPASIVFVPLVLILWMMRGRWLRGIPPRAWPLLIAGAVLPFVPQLINNWRLFRRITPLVAQNLYADQLVWGMKFLKYATLLPPAPLYYHNRWYDGASPSFFSWLSVAPLRAIATASLHLFALFDQDFAFTYVDNIHPWYRWPLNAVCFAYVFIGATTLVAIAARAWRRRRVDRVGFVAIAILAAIGGYLLLYLPTAVESRFSQTVYILLAPFVWLGWRSWWRTRRIAWPVALVAFVVPCLLLSHWLSQQAPALR